MLHGRMLRYLDEVARSGSIRKAAMRLNIAASAINRQIVSLEADLDAPIFERIPGGLRLTATGEILIAHVRETLREHQRTLGRIASLKGLMRGEVVIATVGGLAAGALTTAIASFRSQHPRVKLIVRVLSREAVAQAVLDGEADLGLAYNLAPNPRLFRAMEVSQPIGVVLAPDHPLAGHPILRFADLATYPVVMAERGMSLREAVDLLVPSNIEFAPAVETTSLELMRQLARDVPVVTFMSLIEAYEDLRTGRLAFVNLSGGPTREVVSLVHRASGPLDTAAAVVAQHIKTVFSTYAKQDGR